MQCSSGQNYVVPWRDPVLLTRTAASTTARSPPNRALSSWHRSCSLLPCRTFRGIIKENHHSMHTGYTGSTSGTRVCFSFTIRRVRDVRSSGPRRRDSVRACYRRTRTGKAGSITEQPAAASDRRTTAADAGAADRPHHRHVGNGGDRYPADSGRGGCRPDRPSADSGRRGCRAARDRLVLYPEIRADDRGRRRRSRGPDAEHHGFGVEPWAHDYHAGRHAACHRRRYPDP